MKYEDYYTWQEDVPGFGSEAQEKLRNSTALVSRVGGLGGPLALSLAAAGVGRIILAHGGELRPDDHHIYKRTYPHKGGERDDSEGVVYLGDVGES